MLGARNRPLTKNPASVQSKDVQVDFDAEGIVKLHKRPTLTNKRKIDVPGSDL